MDISQKFQGKIEQVVDSLMGYEPEQIILFGSVARGEADEYSDIDLIVIKDTDQRFVQRKDETGSFISRDTSGNVFVYTLEKIVSMIEDDSSLIP